MNPHVAPQCAEDRRGSTMRVEPGRRALVDGERRRRSALHQAGDWPAHVWRILGNLHRGTILSHFLPPSAILGTRRRQRGKLGLQAGQRANGGGGNGAHSYAFLPAWCGGPR